MVGILGSILLSYRLSIFIPVRRGVSWITVILLSIYFIECVALAMSMGTSVLNVILAFVWGIIGGKWTQKYRERHSLLEPVLITTFYTCIPVISLMLIPLITWLGGWNVFSPLEGYKFGIPGFLNFIPPLNTIFGFYTGYGYRDGNT